MVECMERGGFYLNNIPFSDIPLFLEQIQNYATLDNHLVIILPALI